MKVRDLERSLAGQADELRALSGLDLRLAPSVAETFRNLGTTRVVDMAAVSTSAAALKSVVQPVVTPQIAEALKGIDAMVAPSFTEAMKTIQLSPALNFSKTLADLNAKTLAAIQPRYIEAARALALPKTFTTEIAEAMRALPRLDASVFTPRLQLATEEAVALAEVEAVAEIVDESVVGVEGMSSTQRRNAASDVAFLIAHFLLLAGWLSGAGYTKGAGIALGCAASLVRVYWGLAGKLD